MSYRPGKGSWKNRTGGDLRTGVKVWSVLHSHHLIEHFHYPLKEIIMPGKVSAGLEPEESSGRVGCCSTARGTFLDPYITLSEHRRWPLKA